MKRIVFISTLICPGWINGFSGLNKAKEQEDSPPPISSSLWSQLTDAEKIIG